MPAIQLVYLRLCVLQGLSLAAGFWIFFQLQGAMLNAIDQNEAIPGMAEAIQQIQNTNTKAAIVTFLGTWSLFAGASGLMLLREQRAQLQNLLHQHSDASPSAPELGIVQEEPDEGERKFAVETYSLSLPPVPRGNHLKLASPEEEELVPVSVEEDFPACMTLSLHR